MRSLRCRVAPLFLTIQRINNTRLPENLRLAYRVPFETRKMIASDLRTSGYGNTMKLILLDLQRKSALYPRSHL